MFPLRGVILLPRAVLPLSIYEPRYLSMLEDILSGDRIVGIVQPDRSEGEEESPPGKAVSLRPVGCAGRLTAFQELDDDRVLVTVTGVARFDLAEEVPTTKPYRLSRRLRRVQPRLRGRRRRGAGRQIEPASRAQELPRGSQVEGGLASHPECA